VGWSTVLLEGEEITRHRMNGWQQLWSEICDSSWKELKISYTEQAIFIKFGVGDKNRRCLVCVKFYLNRRGFAAVIAKCLGGSLFWDTVYNKMIIYCLSGI